MDDEAREQTPAPSALKISGLRIDGFKSFVDAVEIPIEQGMTGIVGPNGCGKSNLLEALRWGMGETSAKRLRGGEMDDIIFSGTDRRTARNVAEVAIILDNVKRTAPAEWNGEDTIAVVRRIERGEGSAYRINGQTVRAKQAQIVFRDIGTGPGSAAMISQGRVGAVISAKPVDRRSVLEEAAGVSGLEPRRREAELRLQAAEQNLLRAEDTATALTAQVERLRREARQAQRWREIEGLIKQAEALMLLSKLAGADARLATAGREVEACDLKLADAVAGAAAAAGARESAGAELGPLREARIAHETQVARLDAKREQTRADAERAAKDLDEALRRAGEAGADLEREAALVAEARRKSTEFAEERLLLAEAQAGEGEALEQASDAADAAQNASEALDREHTDLVSKTAEADAIRTEAARRVNETAVRARSASGRLADLMARLQAAQGDAGAVDLARAQAGLAAAEARCADLRLELEAAEAAAGSARARSEEAKTALARAEGAFAALEAEATGLDAFLAQSSGVLRNLDVPAGYEKAIAAALGRELEAGEDSDAAQRWTGRCLALAAMPEDGSLQILNDLVKAPKSIAPKLACVGVVDTREQALAHLGSLEPGAIVVSKDGACVRWDGYVSETPGGGVSERLAAQTRRKELAQLMPAEHARRTEMAAEAAALEANSASSRLKAEDLRRSLVAGQEAERGLRAERDALSGANAEAEARRLSLAEQATHAERDAQMAQTEAAAAAEALQAIPDVGAMRVRMEDLRVRTAAARREAESARANLDGLGRAQRDRIERLDAIMREQADIERRISGADARHAELVRRAESAAAEAKRLEEAPAQAEAVAKQAEKEIDEARTSLVEIARVLDAAERGYVAAELAQRDADQLVGSLREERSGKIAGVTAAQEIRGDVEKQIAERTGGTQADLVPIAGLPVGAEMPSADVCEQKHNKLLRERENMGNVNLLAEEQLVAAIGDTEKLAKERDELRQAIDKLRALIFEIDREAQERIEKAFVQVDVKFRALFTRLFGGGHAQLKLVGGENPLSSGLEIYASPPGKKMQSLSLLSGGEQALTALSLVFAAFLVSPSPICVLDEVDAPLDDANVDRLCSLMEDVCKEDATRFVVVTHHAMTMSRMHRIFGVTMAERGVSRVASIDLAQAARIVEEDRKAAAGAA